MEGVCGRDWGTGVKLRWVTLAAAAALLGACGSHGAKSDDDGGATPSPAASESIAAQPEANATVDPTQLRGWLVGTWSFDAGCATDFIIRYDADGKLDNAGDSGTWKLDGNVVTETVTEKTESGGEAPVKVDPPEVRSYTVARADQTHGTIAYQGRNVSIQRC